MTVFARVKLTVLCLLSAVTLLGCASGGNGSGYYWFESDSGEQPTVRTMVAPPEGSGLAYRPDMRDIEMFQERQSQTGYRDPLQTGFIPSQTHKVLVDYASQLAMELMDGSNSLTTQDLVGVASFVRLNRSLQETTILGNQLSEYLIAELQSFGVGVVDFKLANTLMVTGAGDIAMSRKGNQLAKQMEIDHILTGTLIEEARGVRVNARIVSVSNRRVVASANLFVPAFMVTSLNPAPLVSESD